MTDLNDVALFVKVVDAGSFSKAARLLNLPKATASRKVARLEGDLGVRLLNRTTRRLELTSVGQAFYGQVAQGLAQVGAAREQIAASQAEPSGLLRMTAPVDFGSFILMPWVAAFLGAYDKVEIELRLTDAFVDIMDERVDLAFRTGTLASSSLIARKIAHSRRVLVASPAYLDRHGPLVEIGDLQLHSAVVFGQSLSSAIWRLEGPGGTREFRVHGRIAVDSARAALEAATAGLGIALLPLALVADDLRTGRLEHVFAEWGVAGGLYVVYPSSRHMSAALRAFIDFAAKKAVALPS